MAVMFPSRDSSAANHSHRRPRKRCHERQEARAHGDRPQAAGLRQSLLLAELARGSQVYSLAVAVQQCSSRSVAAEG